MISDSVLAGLAIAFIARVVSMILITGMMILGSVIGGVASVSGMYLSHFFNWPSGLAIVLVAFGFFILAFLLSPSIETCYWH